MRAYEFARVSIMVKTQESFHFVSLTFNAVNVHPLPSPRNPPKFYAAYPLFHLFTHWYMNNYTSQKWHCKSFLLSTRAIFWTEKNETYIWIWIFDFNGFHLCVFFSLIFVSLASRNRPIWQISPHLFLKMLSMFKSNTY